MKDMGESSHVCPYCGYSNNQTEESNTHALKPYTILQGKYLVGNVLGEGGFGITYIGLDLNLEIRVAIKEFYPNGFVTSESGDTSMVTNYTSSDRPQYEKWKDSFVREARSLAKFSDLPGIVHVKDFFQENNTAYIVMEYVEGETLKSHLKNCGGKMPVQETLSMMRPVIQSLAKIHQAQIIHRDISPDNIMIQEGGSVKLIDFGAARDFGNGDDRSLSVLLKPGFAPEEQYRSKGNQGPWTDVDALCATIYRCITGEKPPESMERMRQDTMKYPSSYGISITKSEESALLNGLAVLAENRIKTMGELEVKLYDNTEVDAGFKNSNPVQSLQSTDMGQIGQTTYETDSLQNDTDNSLYSGTANNKGVPDKKNMYIACIATLTVVVLLLIFGFVYGISRNNKYYDEAQVTVNQNSKDKEIISEQEEIVEESETESSDISTESGIENTVDVGTESETVDGDDTESTDSTPSDSGNDNKTDNIEVQGDYRDYLDWSGEYDEGWMDTILYFELYAHGISNSECGYVRENFRGNEFNGTLYYKGNDKFYGEIEYSGSKEGYFFYPKLDNGKYKLDVYDSNGNYECTYVKYSGSDTSDEYAYVYNNVMFTVTVTASDGYVNMRTGPGTEYAIITTISTGEVLDVIDGVTREDNGKVWYKIQYYFNGNWVEGWISETQVKTN